MAVGLNNGRTHQDDGYVYRLCTDAGRRHQLGEVIFEGRYVYKRCKRCPVIVSKGRKVN